MRKYEFVYILDPSLKEKEQKEEIKKVEELVEKSKGKVEKSEIWGKKSLSYPIKKNSEGIYVYLLISMGEQKLGNWEKGIKLNEKILRYLLTRVES